MFCVMRRSCQGIGGAADRDNLPLFICDINFGHADAGGAPPLGHRQGVEQDPLRGQK
jgi:hypothetical protein